MSIIAAKTNTLYNSRFDIKEANAKLMPWKYVLQEWKTILQQTIGLTMMACFWLLLLNKNKTVNKEEKSKKHVEDLDSKILKRDESEEKEDEEFDRKHKS